MVRLDTAQPLVSIAKVHPDPGARRMALETLAFLPLEQDATEAVRPIAEELHHTFPSGALRPRRVTVAYVGTAATQEIQTRLLDRTFDGAGINASAAELGTLAALQPRIAGRILLAGLRQIRLQRLEPARAGQLVLDLARALPERLELWLDEVLRSEEIVRAVPRPALAWALSRVGPEALAEQLGQRITDAAAGEQARLLGWMRDIAASLGTEPPYHAPQREAAPDLSDAERAGEAAFPGVPLYPHIECDQHPVAGSRLLIEVGLSATAQPGVAGGALLPPGSHRVRVHLMLRSISLWGECSVSETSSHPARFELEVPEINADRELIAVRVNFYLGHRWVGEGERNLDVRAAGDVPALRKVPAPALPPWRERFSVEPDAQPPDLLVRIQSDGGAGRYVWHCISRHVNLAAPLADCTIALGKDAETFVRQLFGAHAGKKLSELSTADVQGAGELIYQATPKAFKDAYWAVRREQGKEFDSIQFVTDEPYIPWELMRVSDPLRAPQEKAEILAVRHSVGRWLAIESGGLSQRIRVRNVAVAASDYSQSSRNPQPRPLPWAAEEKKLLQASYQARDVALRSTAVKEFLEQGSAQVFHLACHGTMYVADPMNSALIMEDAEDLKATVVNRQEVREGLGKDRPLVFLNACHVGGSAAALSLVAGFPGAFIHGGAAAIVCPLWVVADETAKNVAEEFYAALLAKRSEARPTLGSVMRTIRKKWSDEGNLTYLAYVLYGDPLAKVDYDP